VSDADRADNFRAMSLGYQVNYLARLLVRLLADRISRYGVVPGQFPQLIALYEHDGLTPTELSRAVDIEPGTMTKTLRRMERDGLVERRPDADDGRAVRIYLTDRGRDLEPDLMTTARSINEAVTETLTKTRRREFLRDLRTVIQRSEQLLNESSHP
jgi:DNA-binding MarR family transcriptional regulator